MQIIGSFIDLSSVSDGSFLLGAPPQKMATAKYFQNILETFSYQPYPVDSLSSFKLHTIFYPS